MSTMSVGVGSDSGMGVDVDVDVVYGCGGKVEVRVSKLADDVLVGPSLATIVSEDLAVGVCSWLMVLIAVS